MLAEEKRRHTEIENKLHKDRIAKEKEVGTQLRFLILGTGASGKSTLFKQVL